MDMIWAQQQSESTDISRKHAVPQLVLFYFRVLLLSHTHVLLKLKRRRDGAMFRILQEVDGDQRKHHDESEPIGSNVFCASLYVRRRVNFMFSFTCPSPSLEILL